MAAEWNIAELGEVARVRSGYAFKSSDWTNEGVPVVKIANVKGGRLEMSGCSYVTPAIAAEAAEFQLRNGDILIAMTGYIGDVARVRATDLPCVLNQRVGKFSISDLERLDADYLFSFLSWSETRKTIEALGYGSAQPNVSPSLIHKVEIPLPPLPEQRAIAHILGALDDKIELNRRMSETLEAMPRAIFKSWFVDFDPVRAKAEGRDPGLPKHLADLFPSRLVDSELGEIPEGWEVVTLDHALRIADGRTLPTEARDDTGKFWAFGANGPIARTPEAWVDCPCIVLGKIGTCGALHRSPAPCWVTNNAFAVRAGKSGSLEFAWHTLASVDFSNYVGGSANPYMPLKNFGHHQIVLPAPALLKRFEAVAGGLRRRLESGDAQSSNLAALRDTLLPKLISGALRLSGAERFLEERGL